MFFLFLVFYSVGDFFFIFIDCEVCVLLVVMYLNVCGSLCVEVLFVRFDVDGLVMVVVVVVGLCGSCFYLWF